MRVAERGAGLLFFAKVVFSINLLKMHQLNGGSMHVLRALPDFRRQKSRLVFTRARARRHPGVLAAKVRDFGSNVLKWA